MSESPHTARVRFFNAMAVIAIVVCVIAVIVFYGLGPGNFGRQAVAPTTNSRTEPRRTPPTRPDEVRKPIRVSPFTDLASENPRLRELALRARPPVEAWLADPNRSGGRRPLRSFLPRPARGSRRCFPTICS